MYLVFETENQIEVALGLLKSKYRYQRLDGKWITPKPEEIPDGLPPYEIEEEILAWYPPESKQYAALITAADKYFNTMMPIAQSIGSEVLKRCMKRNMAAGINAFQMEHLVERLGKIHVLLSMGALKDSITLLSVMEPDDITETYHWVTQDRVNEIISVIQELSIG